MHRLPSQDLQHIMDQTHGLWEPLRGHGVFLTGGSGFVGTWLLESLLWANDKLDLNVKVVALTRDAQRFRTQSPHLARHAAVCLLEGNVVDFAFPAGRFPFVLHVATERSFDPDAQHPMGAYSTDVDGTKRVLDFARAQGVRRFLFTSSGAVYGRQPAGMTHVSEEYLGAPATTDTSSAYGQAKRASEFMCAMYGRVFGFDATIARLFAFVGPLLPLDGQYAVGNFVRDAMSGGPVRIAGDGTPRRSYLYGADLAIWLWTILLRGKAAHPYNVGSSDDLSIKDLGRMVIGVLAPSASLELARKPVPDAPALRYVPCTARAERELGLRSRISLSEGIRRMAAWNREGAPQ